MLTATFSGPFQNSKITLVTKNNIVTKLRGRLCNRNLKMSNCLSQCSYLTSSHRYCIAKSFIAENGKCVIALHRGHRHEIKL